MWPDPSVSDVKEWLRELENLKSQAEDSAEVQARVEAHMVTARMWLEWMEN